MPRFAMLGSVNLGYLSRDERTYVSALGDYWEYKAHESRGAGAEDGVRTVFSIPER